MNSCQTTQASEAQILWGGVRIGPHPTSILPHAWFTVIFGNIEDEVHKRWTNCPTHTTTLQSTFIRFSYCPLPSSTQKLTASCSTTKLQSTTSCFTATQQLATKQQSTTSCFTATQQLTVTSTSTYTNNFSASGFIYYATTYLYIQVPFFTLTLTLLTARVF